jgi:hypothetical protein
VASVLSTIHTTGVTVRIHHSEDGTVAERWAWSWIQAI